MYRQSPSRNQRSRGIKVKHVLQICLLLAVCFWLIYQVKHSHDKKKEFDETDAKALLQKESNDDLIKFGRKDIRSRVEETTSKNEKHEETAEEEEDLEGNKHEEDEPEDKKVEDEVDEHENEKSDIEVDREEDTVDDDEKEREDVDENETQETDTEDDVHGVTEKESSEDNDRDGHDKSTHEAREENYKADDASSAVTHATPTATTDNENERAESSIKRPENILEEENKEDNAEEAKKELEVEVPKDSNRSNVTTRETTEDVSGNSEIALSPNDTVAEGSNGNVTSTSLTEETLEKDGSSLSGPELEHVQGNIPEDTPGSSESEKITVSEASVEAHNNTKSSNEKNDGLETEKSDISDGTDEILENTVTEIPEEVDHNLIDISDSSNDLEEKDVRTDLDTLPEIQTEGTNGDDAAAE